MRITGLGKIANIKLQFSGEKYTASIRSLMIDAEHIKSNGYFVIKIMVANISEKDFELEYLCLYRRC